MFNSINESLISKEDKLEILEKTNEESTIKYFVLDEAIKSAGDYGKYHKINLLFLSLVWIMIPSIPIMLPYFRMLPEYLCEDHTGQRICSTQEICDSAINKIQLEHALKTWATDFNIVCEKPLYFGLLGSFYFMGILCGNLFIARLTDSYGRKPVLITYLILYINISILTILARNFLIFFFVMFMIGVIYSGTSLCTFVINFESSSKERKSLFSTILSMSYGLGGIFHILVFLYFRNWIINVGISCFAIIIVFLFTFHLQESPEFLYVKGRYREMIEVLRTISSVNETTERLEDYLSKSYIQTKISENTEKDKDLTCGIIELIKIEEHRFNLLIMCINWFIMTMVFHGINFNVSHFGTNPYLTGILVYISETLAQATCLYFILNFDYKATLCGFYLISAISLILLKLFLTELNITGFFLIFLAKFGISAVNVCNYIFTADLFPTAIRVAAISFCSLLSRIGGIGGTMLIEVTDNAMIIFGLLCLFTILVIIKIEQK